MESKVKAIRIGLIICIVSLIAIIAIEFLLCRGHWKTILFAISTGLFGSGIITLIIYVTEYFVIKRNSLEQYWEAALKLNSLIKCIQVYNYSDSIDQVKKEIKQVWQDHTKAKWLRVDFDKKELSRDEVLQYGKLDNYKRMAIQVMNSYGVVADYPIADLENAYGNIYYFTGQKHRTRIYNEIHKPLRETYDRVQEVYFHFIPYLKGEHHNFSAIVDYIMNIQGLLFISKDQDIESMKMHSYWNKYADNMEDILENFRANDIYHTEPEKIKKTPVFSTYYNEG